MTAIIAIVQPGWLALLADTSIMSFTDRRLVGTASKISSRDRCAFIMRGCAAIMAPLERLLWALGTDVDELRHVVPAALPEFLRKQELALEPEWRAAGITGDIAGDFDLVVAGWSAARGGPAAWFVTSCDGLHAGVAPWTPIDLDGVAMLPGFAGSAEMIADMNRDGREIDPIGDGRRMMEGQRAAILALPTPGAGCGGACELWYLSEADPWRAEIGTWPDRIGEPLSGAEMEA